MSIDSAEAGDEQAVSNQADFPHRSSAELEELQTKIRQMQEDLHALRHQERTLLRTSVQDATGAPLSKDLILPIGESSSVILRSQTAADFDQLIQKRAPGSAFGNLNAILAREVERELTMYVEEVFLERMRIYVTSLHLSGDDFARQAGFESEEDLHQKVVIGIATDMFATYLSGTGEETIKLSDRGAIERLIDERVSFSATSSSRYTLEQREKDFFRVQVRTIYRIARDIIYEQVKKENLDVTDIRSFAESYAQKNAGMTFDQLVEHLTYRVTNALWERYPDRHAEIQIARIRHDCLNELITFQAAHFFPEEPHIDHEKLLADFSMTNLLTTEFHEIFNQCQRENVFIQFGARGTTVHTPLPVKDQEFVKDITLRMAGFDHEGNPQSLDKDFELFTAIEQQLTEWKKPFQGEQSSFIRDEERAAIQRFNREGGHAGLMTKEQFEFIAKHGLIFFIQKKIHDDLHLLLGTISAMSRTPCSPDTGQEPEGWHQEPETLRLFPQYDLRDLMFPPAFSEETMQALYQSARRRLLICRTSILSLLSSAVPHNNKCDVVTTTAFVDRNLRRLSLAARAKYSVLRIGKHLGNDLLTFNIGQIDEPGTGIKMVNEPSSRHNSWAQPLTWHRYYTPLKGNLIRMAWTGFEAGVDDGIYEFIRPHGHITGKGGWKKESMDASTDVDEARVQWLIERGLHAPW